MAYVSIQNLRNHASEVVDRAAWGEQIIITRSGAPIAELKPINRQQATAEELIDRYRHAPSIDYRKMREELDSILDPSLPNL